MANQTTIKGIPVFRATVAVDETGMQKISLVDAPAVESDFLAFAREQSPQCFAVEDEEKRLIFGPVMRANFPIYRRDPLLGEYFIKFDPETIRVMAEKYLVEGRQNDVNTMHAAGSDVEGVDMVQYFIKDTAAGLAPTGFADIEDGSLFAEFHVNNDDVWAKVKDGTFRGFSLEGLFGMEPETSVISTEKVLLRDALAALESKDNKSSEDMTLIERMKAALVRGIKAAEQAAQKFGSVSTDKGTLIWEGDEDLAAGMAVWQNDADGNRIEAADGDYTVEDQKVISVADGKVAEIRDKEAEVAPEEGSVEAAKETMRKTIRDKFAQLRQVFSYDLDEVWRHAYDALREILTQEEYEYSYIVELGNDYMIVERWIDGEERGAYVRYSISISEDGFVTVDTDSAEEVKRAWVPVDRSAADESEAEQLRSQLADRDAEIAALKAKLQQPAGKPAHEAYRAATKTPAAFSADNPLEAAKKYLK